MTVLCRHYDTETRQIQPTSVTYAGQQGDTYATTLRFSYDDGQEPATFIIFDVKDEEGNSYAFDSASTPPFDGTTFAIPLEITTKMKTTVLRYQLAWVTPGGGSGATTYSTSHIDNVTVLSSVDPLMIYPSLDTFTAETIDILGWIEFFKQYAALVPVGYDGSQTLTFTPNMGDGCEIVLNVPVLGDDGKIQMQYIPSSVFRFKGVKDTAAELPTEGNQVGDIWYVREDSSEYIWINQDTDPETYAWEKLGPLIDYTVFQLKENLDTYADGWPIEPADTHYPSTKLVKTETDKMLTITGERFAWDVETTYARCAIVVRDLTIYTSLSNDNIGHDPADEDSEWWAKVQGGSSFVTFSMPSPSADNEGTVYYYLGTTGAYVYGHVYRCIFSEGVYSWSDMGNTFSVWGDISGNLEDQTDLSGALDSKVDKITGKGLSTEDYTTAEKSKLATIAEGAEVNINPDWDATSGGAEILNKPVLGTVATKDTGISPGQVPVLNVDGKLPDSVIPPFVIGVYAGSVATRTQLVTLSNAQQGDITYVTADTVVSNNGTWFLNGIYSNIAAWIQIAGPGNVISVNGQTGVVTLSYSDVGAVPTTRMVNNKVLSSDISLGASDVGAVPTTRKVNNKALSADVVLTPADVGAVPPERMVNEKPLSADIVLSPADIGAVPPERTVNGHALSSDVVLDAVDVGAVEANAGIVAGTFTKVTVDAKGLVTLGEALDAADIPSLPASKIGSGTLNVSRIPTGNGANLVLMLTAEIGIGQSIKRTAIGWDPYTPSDITTYTGTIIGDGTTKTFTLNHGLGRIPIVTLYEDGEIISTTVVCTTSTIQVTFFTAPATGDTFTIKAIA